MSTRNSPQGIYLTFFHCILSKKVLIPLWTIWEWLFKEKFRKTILVGGGTEKLHPAVAESYQLIMIVILSAGLCVMPCGQTTPWWWLFVIIALYRAWEILIYGLKWLLIDEDPLHSHRRSLISFMINIVEVSASYTLAGLSCTSISRDAQWKQVVKNIGSAFKLECPDALSEPYASLFVIEAALLIVFILACVIGGIQRKPG